MTWWKPWTWFHGWDTTWAWLTNLPPVQAKMFSLVVLDFLTFWAVTGTVSFISISDRAQTEVLDIWIAWFSYMAALHGVSYVSYRTQRVTEQLQPTETPRSMPATQPPQATADGTVVVTPATVQIVPQPVTGSD